MKDKKVSELTIIVTALIAVLIIFLISIWYVNSTSIEIAERGAYGDKFGAVNAFFSGLAFAGIIVTIYLQTKELKLQRNELSQTRNTFNSQKNDNTFFKLLNLRMSILNNITVEHKNTNGETGIVSFKNFIGDFAIQKLHIEFIRKEIKNIDQYESLDNYTLMKASKKYFEYSRINSYDAYISNFKTIVNFIEEPYHFGVLRSVLNPIERVVLLHVCLIEENKQLFDLCLKWDLLSNIRYRKDFFYNSLHFELVAEKIMTYKYLQYDSGNINYEELELFKNRLYLSENDE